MPELPEVEIVVRELREQVLDKTIKKIDVLWDKTYEQRCSLPVAGQVIKQIGRKGKYILLYMPDSVLVVHLRMTGQLLFMEKPENGPAKHIRAVLSFDDGSRLYFKDVRKFGRIYHVKNAGEAMPNVGEDAMSAQMDGLHFSKLLHGHSMGIKAFLLNQRFLAGVGNIYADESLFKAGIHPGRDTRSILADESMRLFKTLRETLQQAINNMGSTISDYRDTRGNEGTNQKYFNVYGRAGKQCKSCGSILEKTKMAGRGTHYCPNCQK